MRPWERTVLVLLDVAFFVVHTALIAFNLVGWAWRRTRPWHLVSLGLTAFSWFVLGAWYGWGYCVCTDWHFRVRGALGHVDGESNYVQLLAKYVLGLSLSRTAADWIAGSTFAFIVVATAIAWVRDRRRTRSPASPDRRSRPP